MRQDSVVMLQDYDRTYCVIEYDSETGEGIFSGSGLEGSAVLCGFASAPSKADVYMLPLFLDSEDLFALYVAGEEVVFQSGTCKFVLCRESEITLRRSLVMPWMKVFSIYTSGSVVFRRKYLSWPLRGLWDPDYIGDMEDIEDFFVFVERRWGSLKGSFS